MNVPQHPAPPRPIPPAPVPTMYNVGQARLPDGTNMVMLSAQTPQGQTVLFMDLKGAESIAKAILRVVGAGMLTLPSANGIAPHG